MFPNNSGMFQTSRNILKCLQTFHEVQNLSWEHFCYQYSKHFELFSNKFGICETDNLIWLMNIFWVQHSSVLYLFLRFIRQPKVQRLYRFCSRSNSFQCTHPSPVLFCVQNVSQFKYAVSQTLIWNHYFFISELYII